MKMIKAWAICFYFFITCLLVQSQPLHPATAFTRQDTLRGSITPERAWWDVRHYAISITPDFTTKTLQGSNEMSFLVLSAANKMQIDLQVPMQVDSVRWKNKAVPYTRDGNTYQLLFPELLKKNSVEQIVIHFSGKPKEAVNPPWDGGWIWRRDAKGNPWMSVACQGLGASVWYPCKDHQGDEPDSASVRIVVPDSLVAISNGRLRSKQQNDDGTTAYSWAVTSSINAYNLVAYIGKYINWTETISGEKGPLDCSFWVLADHEDSAKEQFKQVRSMFSCFEKWFGPYPFYEDSYKLVESPHLGMEHQSAVAYGNHFRNGYLGRDLSASGWGLKWDFIIVHESAHEWFGNNITSKDIADMWIHESFANYAEALYTECQFGKEAAVDYVVGTRKLILNNIPIIGPYEVNREGSGDMYYKGGNMIHMIRTIMQDDDRFRNMLRGMNKTFYHQTVTARQVEDYINTFSGKNFNPVFRQYLLTTQIPVLEYRIKGNQFSYRWSECVPGFDMPVKITLGKSVWIKPTEAWQTMAAGGDAGPVVDRDFYIRTRKVD